MFDFSNKTVRQGKISNNLEKHGDEDVKAFDIPITCLLDGNELDELCGGGTAKRFFQKANGVDEPAAVFKHCEPLSFKDDFEGANVTLLIEGEGEFSYENTRVSKIELEPAIGGLTTVTFSLRVRPDDADECFALLENQNRELKLTISDAKIAKKKSGRQQDLPLGDKEAEASAASTTH